MWQGKLLLVDKFDIWEKNDLRRRYKGVVFLFERCIIYTEKVAKDKLIYRGHFWQTTLGFTFDEKRNCFGLYNERKGNRDIEFATDASKLQTWIRVLNQTMESIYLLGRSECFYLYCEFDLICWCHATQSQSGFTEKRKVENNRASVRSNESSALQTLLRNCSPSVSDVNPATPVPRRYTDSMFSSSSSQSNSLWEFKDDTTSAETVSLRSDRKFLTQ